MTTEVRKMLATERERTLKEIGVAAEKSDAVGVLNATDKLRAIEALLARQGELDCAARALLDQARSTQAPGIVADTPPPPTRSIEPLRPFERVPAAKLFDSARAIGAKRRDEFMEKVRKMGKHLEQVRGQLCRNAAGAVVGIAFASERAPDRWFLGLPAGEFDNAVLLCENRSGRVFAVCLPKAFFDRYGESISEAQGQKKFNVALRNGRWAIKSPSIGAIDVTANIDNPGLIA